MDRYRDRDKQRDGMVRQTDMERQRDKETDRWRDQETERQRG